MLELHNLCNTTHQTKFVSLLQMLKIDTNGLLAPLSFIGAAISEWRLLQQLEGYMVPKPISQPTKIGFLKSLQLMQETSAALNMTTTDRLIENHFEDAVRILASNAPLRIAELQTLISFAQSAIDVFTSEAESRLLMAVPHSHAAYMNPQSPLFGDAVEDAFPSSTVEIVDAGRCRAVGLWTATVMHLMRALEPALRCLATSVDVDAGRNWNTALNQIESKLREVKRSSDGETAEQWASEAALQLRAVKNAWRNHAMHGRIRYNEDEAVDIYNSVKMLMQSLSLRLSE